MSIRSFAADLLPVKLHGLARTPVAAAQQAEVTTFAELSEKLGYLSKADLKKVREAYKFADQAHLGQLRASGIPYITHPLAVTGLVADWKLDAQALMAALMHDTIEDCGVTKPELIDLFGAPTADLVDGLTKLDKLQFSTREDGQAESFRKMLLAMSRDVRVILIKLCDRLHNMRTMEAMAANKRARIARETIEIFAPIAHRLGLNQMYRELQDLSFRFMYPWRYAAVAKALERARGTRRDIVDRMRRDVEKAFAEAYQKKFNRPAADKAWMGWITAKSLFEAIELAKSTETMPIIEGLENWKFTAGATSYSYRKWDHQMLLKNLVVQVKEKIPDQWDYFDVKAALPENPADLDKVFGTQEEVGCKMM